MSTTSEISQIEVLGYGANNVFNFHTHYFKFRFSHSAAQDHIKAAGQVQRLD